MILLRPAVPLSTFVGLSEIRTPGLRHPGFNAMEAVKKERNRAEGRELMQNVIVSHGTKEKILT